MSEGRATSGPARPRPAHTPRRTARTCRTPCRAGLTPPPCLEFERTVASYEEVTEFRRMYGRPGYFIRAAVADHAACEAFLTGKLSGLPGVLRFTSHLTMKTIKSVG
ncbi:Lrp/AsnC ligand binding domain-containing protein [Streptomyces sp. NPDC056160]|uniref:Lrp/AsnC ligand binding domain-containing protein n=1 Tax=Streptomyces sp. NPDC056160 TaxID=3345731 RepID=UPI0035D616B2